MDTMTNLKGETGRDARRRIRAGTNLAPTSGMAPGFVQGNLAILPKALAADFARFCQLNPKPCPLLGQSEPGDPRLPMLGEDLDIRTDIPLYRIWKNGEMVDEVRDLKKVWRDDLVSFVLGCSFSFEEALIENGLEIRHQTCNSNVPMYRTNIECKPAGPVPRPDGGVDAAVQAGRRDPRRAGDDALPLGAWRAGPSRQARADRHKRHRQARLRRRRARA